MKAAADEYDAGRRAFKSKDYESAAVHFENADRDAPAAESLRSAIRSRKAAKDDARAATLAAAAKARYPEDKATVALVRPILVLADRKLHRVVVTCAPACALVADGKLVPDATSRGASATDSSETTVVYVNPGRHVFIAGWPSDRSRTQAVAAIAGGRTTLSFEAPPIAPKRDETPAPPPPPPPSGLPKGVFFGALGATLVLGGVATWSGVDTVNNPGKDRVRRECAGKDESCAAYREGLAAQTRTNVLIGVTGGVAVATAVVGLFFTDWKRGASEASGLQVLPAVASHGGPAVVVEGRF